MSVWFSLKENPPSKTEGFVLGCDWYRGEEERDFRMAICELPTVDAYWCGIKQGKALDVFKSICPAIGHGHNAHWMEIPADNWIKFDAEKYPHRELTEILIKLINGNYYVGFIELGGILEDWCPSFNMMKHGSIEDIDYWEMPQAPKYVAKPPLTKKDKAIEKKFLKSFYAED